VDVGCVRGDVRFESREAYGLSTLPSVEDVLVIEATFCLNSLELWEIIKRFV